MKIIFEHEMDGCDRYAAYLEQKELNLTADIQSRMKEMEIDPDSVDINTILIRAQRAIDRDDCLWDAYWRDIEYAIEQEIDANNKEA